MRKENNNRTRGNTSYVFRHSIEEANCLPSETIKGVSICTCDTMVGYVCVNCFVVCGCPDSRMYINVCNSDVFSVVNRYLDNNSVYVDRKYNEWCVWSYLVCLQACLGTLCAGCGDCEVCGLDVSMLRECESDRNAVVRYRVCG